MTPWSRRRVLAGLTLGLTVIAGQGRAATPFTVYRSAACGCCEAWMVHMAKAGFAAKSVLVDDLVAVRRRFNVPEDVAGCHTAVIHGYAIEGHVPAQDVTALLRRAPRAVGLAVPGMPIGSPGMTVPGAAPESYSTLLLLSGGRRQVFARH
ncbi:DUF411 domain-containing protein [Caulobacter henricii]|uniref:Metal-binding protein n=1 Tax=Caulobacter henricii TaxID=69395 RepID=A0A0P0P4D8_9CAUL|nr:DUF411 domain-containing protein [Caulobacter henricii]ALL15478.1 hypothetical protein AQ619_18510 [Caulobacter henricii]